MLDIALLGTGGMLPLPNRYLSALLVRYRGRMLLVDCGEGTQIALRRLGWGFVNLDSIIFTHFHADHIAGLPGMLLSLGNYGRKNTLNIVGPEGIEKITNSLRLIAPELPYPLRFIELPVESKDPIPFQLGEFHLFALPLSHTLTCFGYNIQIPRAGKFDLKRAKAQDVPVKYWSRLQRGERISGFTPDMVLGKPRRGIKVSYITDTRPIDTIPAFVEDADLFICEAMHGDDQFKPLAERYRHMMFSEAAKLAGSGQVKELWLTHSSPALTDPEEYLPAVRKIFKNTVAGADLMTRSLKFED